MMCPDAGEGIGLNAMPERYGQIPASFAPETGDELTDFCDRHVRDASRLLRVLESRFDSCNPTGNKPLYLLESLSKIALEHALEAEMSGGLLSASHNEYSLVARCAMQIVIRGMSDRDEDNAISSNGQPPRVF